MSESRNLSYYKAGGDIFSVKNKIKAVKFGGSSLCDARSIDNAVKIVLSDDSRKYIAVSAPGKRFPGDEKITDMLYRAFMSSGDEFYGILEKIKARFDEIISGLSLPMSLDDEFSELIYGRKNYFGRDYFASRGEYFCAKIFSAYLGFDFIDAARCISFGENGAFLPELTKLRTAAELSGSTHAVVPGFYGSMPGGTLKTFERGGSDITGAILASAAGCDEYENWTDVSGFMSADPKTVDNPKTISIITYKELRRLSFMGAGVLHEDSVIPLMSDRIPVIIKNTLDPEAPGTRVVSVRNGENDGICGIAGKKGFCILRICKTKIGTNTADTTNILRVLSQRGVSPVSISSGIDCISFTFPKTAIIGREDYIRSEICACIEPVSVTKGPDCALITIVGADPQSRLSDIFSALNKENIAVISVDAGSGDGGITIGVDEDNLDRAIKALYAKLIKRGM